MLKGKGMTTIKLQVESKTGGMLEEMCSKPCPDTGRGEVLFDEEVRLGNGMFASIQVIASLDPESEPAWSQVVIFDEESGCEMGFTEPSDSFYGEYELEDCTVIVERKDGDV